MNLSKNIVPIVFLTLAINSIALAKVSFSEQEVSTHKSQVRLITETAAKCLDNTYNEHLDFFAKWNVSKFYGDRRDEHKTRQGRISALQRFGAPASLVDSLEPISCIGLTVKCLKQGFEAAGQAPIWKKIHDELKVDNKMYGTDLQNMLQQLGWKIYYWNPDPSKNAAWDEEDRKINPLPAGKKWNPVWGGHAYRYSLVMNKGIYYESKIDNARLLVGFKLNVPEEFKRIPFFVGTAHAGYHVFPGRYGDVIEAHSTRPLNSKENLEFNMFNPLETGGAPVWTNTERYRSGMIVIPPL